MLRRSELTKSIIHVPLILRPVTQKEYSGHPKRYTCALSIYSTLSAEFVRSLLSEAAYARDQPAARRKDKKTLMFHAAHSRHCQGKTLLSLFFFCARSVQLELTANLEPPARRRAKD
ncbi:hypothetical protein KP509_06G049600 [Ceratopteris richardii]|uniref:Uncharacterized protein n=1 Tax=Ceratopteris richardii TaxID=49495 RepID=A0A8T2UI00_CERRI|nr:hypothetical protein KP509_06G049600 [Ceratopteris richardii]